MSFPNNNGLISDPSLNSFIVHPTIICTIEFNNFLSFLIANCHPVKYSSSRIFLCAKCMHKNISRHTVIKQLQGDVSHFN